MTYFILRIHLGFLNGALLAVLFPVLDTCNLPFEVEVYWIQHILMLLIPVILIISEDDNIKLTPARSSIISYAFQSFSICSFYHLILLQPLALVSGINLNFLLCPAPSDPFSGPHYVLHAHWTQAILIPVISTVYCSISYFFALNKIKMK